MDGFSVLYSLIFCSFGPKFDMIPDQKTRSQAISWIRTLVIILQTSFPTYEEIGLLVVWGWFTCVWKDFCKCNWWILSYIPWYSTLLGCVVSMDEKRGFFVSQSISAWFFFFFAPKTFGKIPKKSKILENAWKQFFSFVHTMEQNIGPISHNILCCCLIFHC